MKIRKQHCVQQITTPTRSALNLLIHRHFSVTFLPFRTELPNAMFQLATSRVAGEVRAPLLKHRDFSLELVVVHIRDAVRMPGTGPA